MGYYFIYLVLNIYLLNRIIYFIPSSEFNAYLKQI